MQPQERTTSCLSWTASSRHPARVIREVVACSFIVDRRRQSLLLAIIAAAQPSIRKYDLRPRLDGDEVHGDEESAGLPRGDAGLGDPALGARLPLGPAHERRGVPDVAARVPVGPRRGGPVGPAGRAHRLPVHLLLDLLGAQPHGGGRLRPVDRRPAVVDPAGGVHAALVRRAAVAPRRADVRAHAHVGPPPHVQLCAQGRLLGRRGLPLGRDPQVVQRAGLEVGGLQPRLHLLRPAGAPPPPPPPPPARPRRPHAFSPSLRRNR